MVRGLRTHGCSLPFEKYSACIGTIGGFDLHGYLEEQSGRTFERADLETACNTRWLELMKGQPLLPGIAACVSSAKARGMKLAVASSSTQKWVTRNLRRFELLDHFDAVCTSDYVSAVKPDPALYLLALERLARESRRGDRVRRLAERHSRGQAAGHLLHRDSQSAHEGPVIGSRPIGGWTRSRSSTWTMSAAAHARRRDQASCGEPRRSARMSNRAQRRDIIAIGGGGFLAEPRNLALEKYILEQTGKARPNVLMIPTARGDDAEYVAKFHAAFRELGARTQHLPFFHRTPDLRSLILAQDAIFVGGGNTKSMLAVWREWGLPELLKRSVRIGHRPGWAERRRDLLVRAGRHRFVGRSAAAARLHGISSGQLLPALRRRGRTPARVSRVDAERRRQAWLCDRGRRRCTLQGRASRACRVEEAGLRGRITCRWTVERYRNARSTWRCCLRGSAAPTGDSIDECDALRDRRCVSRGRSAAADEGRGREQSDAGRRAGHRAKSIGREQNTYLATVGEHSRRPRVRGARRAVQAGR